METSQRQKLLQKLPHIRRWRSKPSVSYEALSGSVPTDEAKRFVYSLRNLVDDSAADMSPDQAAHTIDQSHNLRVDVEPLVDFATFPAPRYTPMPIPDRMSSVKTESVGSRRRRQADDGKSAVSNTPLKHTDDDVSFKLSGLEEEGAAGEETLHHSGNSMDPLREDEPSRGRPRTRPLPSPPAQQATSSSKASSRVGNVPYTFNNGIDRPQQARLHGALHDTNQLPSLQNPLADKCDVPHTELYNVDDPESWDVLRTAPQEQLTGVYSLEERAEQLYSREHLALILADAKFRVVFTNFLRKYRPWRMPVLELYWKARKAIAALQYTNSLVETLFDTEDGNPASTTPPSRTENYELQSVADQSLEALRREDLHYYIAHTYIRIVSSVVQRRIMGKLSAQLRETSHGLAEVFCVVDPSRPGQPIILASQEFTRHSGCSLTYVLGRNCNFMQGPGTTLDSRRRFAQSCAEARDHTEIFVNYRRDGSPFMSLVMNAPLLDSRGKVRYFLGAQVDVSGLLKETSGLPSLKRLVQQHEQAAADRQSSHSDRLDPRAGIKALSQMFNTEELEIIRQHGGRELQETQYINGAVTEISTAAMKAPRRVLIEDVGGEEPKRPSTSTDHLSIRRQESQMAGNLEGLYKHYLLVRPYPSLRILFVSPRLRAAGILQSPFLHRIGGPRKLRQDLEAAFRDGHAVTAKVRWLDAPDEEGHGDGRIRWVHCTPLMHYEERIGLWMVVVVMGDENLVEEEGMAV